jgi:predicted dehydrogenase
MAYTTYEQMLQEPLDVLFVSLPNYLAPQVTIAGLELGMHVFCEKPPGRTVAEMQQVLGVHRQRPRQALKYGFNHRYHDSVIETKRRLDSGELGEILNIRGVYGKSKIISFASGWRAQRQYSGGGILLDQGIHMLDLLRYFCGEFAVIASHVSNAYWHHDVEDNAMALLRDERGRVAMIHSSATQWQHRFAMDIALSQGFIELQGILSGSQSYGRETLIIGRRNDADTGCCREERITYTDDHSWPDEINEFAACIVDGQPVVNGTPEDALRSMELVAAIYRADPAWAAQFPLT